MQSNLFKNSKNFFKGSENIAVFASQTVFLLLIYVFIYYIYKKKKSYDRNIVLYILLALVIAFPYLV